MNFHYDDTGVEIHCLGVGDFKDLSIIADTTILPKILLNEMPSNDYLLQNDDIVFVRSNGNKALVGRSLAIYPNDTPTTFSGFCIRPESVKLKNQISSKVSLEAKNKAKSSHSKCTQKVHENWKPPAFYAIIEVDKSGIGCGKNEL